MANAITRTKILNDSKNYIVRFTVIGDGSGEETATIVNATTGDMGTKNSIRRVIANLSGFSARLLFDASTDLYAWQIPSDFPTDNDFRDTSNIPNNAGTGKTGDIVITTSGLGTGDSGTLILFVEKSSV